MKNSESFYRRERFEASLRRCGWTQEEITYEWYKVESDNYRYGEFRRLYHKEIGFISAKSFLSAIEPGV